ncbi:TetR/AcrR family transcriptional regulator [Halofilum ochraceum]|uniref:TetR/AcrR family transcriptional regulator n=1 Tax=Halofilum ochraceum TaxID=1611323 RepID=UPI0008D9EE1A|nr:TetR/AcrR family transcriptional regulator [Halofilum ochraceum]
MAYDDTRSALIAAGMRDMLLGGYDSVGIAGVLARTGVPKGSFYHYFDSKESFGRAIVEAYAEEWRATRQATFARAALGPVERLEAHFLELEEDVIAQEGMGGCLLGNLSQLMASRSAVLRRAVETGFQEWQDDIVGVLLTAQSTGELPSTADPEQIAALVIEAYEGALMRAKSQSSLMPLKRFREITLKRLLGS